MIGTSGMKELNFNIFSALEFIWRFEVYLDLFWFL